MSSKTGRRAGWVCAAAVAVLAVCLAACPLRAADHWWTGDANGNGVWSWWEYYDDYWNPHCPENDWTGSDRAIFNRPGSYTVVQGGYVVRTGYLRVEAGSPHFSNMSFDSTSRDFRYIEVLGGTMYVDPGTYVDAYRIYVGGDSGGSSGAGTIETSFVAPAVDLRADDLLKVWSGGWLRHRGGTLWADTIDLAPGGMFTTSPGTVVHTNRLVGFGNVVSFAGGLDLGWAWGASSCDIAVGAGQTLSAADYLTVGWTKPATLTVTGGGQVTSGLTAESVVAKDPLAAGSTVTIQGTGSKWTDSTHLKIGVDANADVFVYGQGELHTHDATVAYNSPSASLVSVSNNGSKWTNDDYLVVGDQGTGRVYAFDYGMVKADSCALGYWPGARGEVYVSDHGSLEIGDYMDVGTQGLGLLDIASGGRVKALTGDIYVAAEAGSTGTVAIAGAGSELHVQNLAVGGYWGAKGGVGTVSVSGGATLRVDGELRIWRDGTVDVAANQTLSAGAIEKDFSGSGAAPQLLTGALATVKANRLVDFGSHTFNGVLILGHAEALSSGGPSAFTGGQVLTVTQGMAVGYDAAATLDLAGGQASSLRGFVGMYAGGNGVVNINGSGARWDVADDLYIGGTDTVAGGSGLVHVANGQLVVQDVLKVWPGGELRLDNSGDVTADVLNVTQGLLTTAGNCHLQVNTLQTPAGLLTINGNLGFGYSSVGSGAASHTVGAGQGLAVSSVLYVGESLPATVTFNGGSSSSIGQARVGNGSAGAGTVTVEGGATLDLTNANSLYVAYGGAGTLNVRSGGCVAGLDAFLSSPVGSSASVLVQDGGSRLEARNLYVGGSAFAGGGSGTLTIGSGGVVQASDRMVLWGPGAINHGAGGWIVADTLQYAGGILVNNAGSVLRVNHLEGLSGYGFAGHLEIGHAAGVSGAGAHDVGAGAFWAGGDLTIGADAPGTLGVTAGTVSNYAGFIGRYAGSDGSSVTMNGGTWSNNFLTVGMYGDANLTVSGGAQVSSGSARIAEFAGSDSMVRVYGGGSRWDNPGWLAVGPEGNGAMEIFSGGTLALGGLYMGNSPGGRGFVSVYDGTLQAAEIHLELLGTAGLGLEDPAANVIVTQLLAIGNSGTLMGQPGTSIRMSEALFDNRSTDPFAHYALSTIALHYAGAAGGQYEAAGHDYGAVPAGWANNFAIGELHLGGPARGALELLDNFDNMQDGQAQAEAAYVHTLTMDYSATILPTDVKLYYLNGGDPKQFFLGDATLDGAVDVSDLSLLAGNYRRTSGQLWAGGDFNGDGAVDVSDLSILAGNYRLSTVPPPGVPVPEPATLILMAGGGLAILRRRRGAIATNARCPAGDG